MNESDYDPRKYAKPQRNETPSIPDDLPALEDVTLPEGDGEYTKAHGTARTKPVATLHCIIGKDGYESFNYASLGRRHKLKYTPAGQEIVLEFVDGERTRVTIKGRNLLKAFDYILQHRMPWIRVSDRDFASDKESIITAIVIEEVIPE